MDLSYIYVALLVLLVLGVAVLAALSSNTPNIPRVQAEKNLDNAEKRYWDQADELIVEITSLLSYAPLLDEQKRNLRSQAVDVQNNILRSGQILRRLRKTNAIIARQTKKTSRELDDIEVKRQKAICDSLDVLRSIPVALLKIESARDARSIDDIIKTLAETNQRMRDIADVHEELHQSR